MSSYTIKPPRPLYSRHLPAKTNARLEQLSNPQSPAGSEGSVLRDGDRSRAINATYDVVPDHDEPTGSGTRLTLQKRKTVSRRADAENQAQAPEKRLTLKRRTRTASTGAPGAGRGNGGPPRPKVLSEPNTGAPWAAATDANNPPAKSPRGPPEPGGPSKTFSTPTKTTRFGTISAKKDVFERLAGRDPPPGRAGAPQVRRGAALMSAGHNAGQRCAAPGGAPSAEPPTAGTAAQEPPKMENSAVTVAVRVRPFSGREKTEDAAQVVFVDNQETVVRHPDSKQYTFSFNFSFCSVDKADPNFASQQQVYERLALPLLERAFEGFNTCLFAYGQTGSGKSYTMMGYGEEVGVIPRFCEDLFSRLSRSEVKETTFHLEMSYFEIYNEKIHDLLVVNDQNQKKLPLRVREHPVHGPYVAELSTNVVSCYADIQGWLELGNKQRATAATGMNDKSSRSHSVFTLVMTQTKTESVEGEDHDHSIISRINLVDLAGSERCSASHTVGDRLKEGASINKSLLTLGKVISSLSEQAQARRKVFIPYRESVLTWLLKESLGGNSKTAMIATLSPAASSVEESLSTLRYAQQARMIINIAKVNEDTNAKIIRDLKAEVEKLRAAQMSSQGIEPEKIRLFKQEITSLKTKLSQQEREIAEAHRAWKEKLEHAERRKREETKELQRAGITFKVDNRLPNLVNLNEDPQLSEMLLYMIKEGQTKVGRLKSDSAHDIQLSGTLIADQHCVISNERGTVSITPMENAKTFVNGNLLSASTVLHHGDRVILGGDHYFRFNHPREVQSGGRVSCWFGEGQRDFEFAKNELLSAQRAQLEAEIEEARLKAKEEMIQGIQVAKEVAQKELTEQKIIYEDRIKALEQELEEQSQRKKLQELDKRRVASEMEELQAAKTLLEQQVHTHKKRLHLEAQATRQAMADHVVRHAKIVEALEAEKKKIAEDLAEQQKKHILRENQTQKSVCSAPPQWDAMKLSLMIQEANTISKKLRKHTVFSRHEVSDTGSGEGIVQVHVQNTKLGITTFWSLEKFQSNLAAIRDLDQGDCTSKDDDVFYDPNDEWEQDISASSNASSLSRRRSRSLLKSRRISGRLYEIRVHPIQSLHSPAPQATAGLIGVSKASSQNSSPSDSALPGICKHLIGQTVARLRSFQHSDESVADKLTSDLLSINESVRSISGLYDHLDDNSPENLFACCVEAQTHLVKGTSAIERVVFITMYWVSCIKPNSSTIFQTAEELKSEVKKIGGYFQLLIQGCDSEISSMVTEAQSKMGRCVSGALRVIAQLAVLTSTEQQVIELGSDVAGKPPLVSLVEGTCRGIRGLLEEALSISNDMLREAQLVYPKTQNLQNIKTKMLDTAHALQSYLYCNVTQRRGSSEQPGEVVEAESQRLCEARSMAATVFRLNHALRQLHSSLSNTLRGKGDDASISCIHSTSKTIDDIISGLQRYPGVTGGSGLQVPCMKNVMAARDDVHSALHSLVATFEKNLTGKRNSRGSEGSMVRDWDGSSLATSSSDPLLTHCFPRSKTVPKIIYTLTSGPVPASKDIHWV
ncbi:kinesin-like protein KIF14 isoform X2 [Denticeps clupeoides]|uniref:kinesin-like protein KIF14 isoform X2 n=1 Tax=Denticeps clupeoides TaxID=299321 RepID=UPI0010A3D819|nr:kinesin-like protein KIF14 isoform X2 [Denticeps clupeoides]